ncbi:Putative AC transposase [Linum grandiflorum]
MCVTAHFTGKDWKLHKKIITFVEITSRAGADIGETLTTCLEGLKNVLSIAVDNATANDTTISHMKEKLKEWGTDFFESSYLHVRCAAHIINLVVHEHLKSVGISVKRVREAVNTSLIREEHAVLGGGRKGGSRDGFLKRKLDALSGGRKVSRFELEKYLVDEEESFDLQGVTDTEFDILRWWKGVGGKYPILFEIARDVLDVPITTVASESTISTGVYETFEKLDINFAEVGSAMDTRANDLHGIQFED